MMRLQKDGCEQSAGLSVLNGTQSSNRIPYLDLARSIAIISITFNHAVNRSFAIDSGQFAEFCEIPFWLTLIKVVLYAFSRIGVPIFVMISGALLLPRSYEMGGTKKFLKKNWLPLLITTEIWLAIMFWYKQFSPGSILMERGIAYCMVRFVMTLLFISPITMNSMWYMPMILCLYLLIPILSVALKKLDQRYFLLPMAIVLFCSFLLPDVNGALGAAGFSETLETDLNSVHVFSMYAVCLLMGYFISQGALSGVSSKIVMLVLLVAAVLFCGFQLWIYSLEYHYVVGKGYHSVFPVVIAASLFELLRRGSLAPDGALSRASAKLARVSFGIYFVHICIMEGLIVLIQRLGLDIVLLPRFFVLEVVSFFGAIGVILLFGKSKLASKYLFGIK